MSQLSMSEQLDLRTIAEAYFGKHNTAHWEMNEELLDVITKMINAEKSCSKAMDLVPRPGAYLTPKDVLKELARIAKRVAIGGASYSICRDVAKGNWQQAAEIAAISL